MDFFKMKNMSFPALMLGLLVLSALFSYFIKKKQPERDKGIAGSDNRSNRLNSRKHLAVIAGVADTSLVGNLRSVGDWSEYMMDLGATVAFLSRIRNFLLSGFGKSWLKDSRKFGLINSPNQGYETVINAC